MVPSSLRKAFFDLSIFLYKVCFARNAKLKSRMTCFKTEDDVYVLLSLRMNPVGNSDVIVVESPVCTCGPVMSQAFVRPARYATPAFPGRDTWDAFVRSGADGR